MVVLVSDHSAVSYRNRFTVDQALQQAGLDAGSVTPGQMTVVLERVLPRELEGRGVSDAGVLCGHVCNSENDSDAGVLCRHGCNGEAVSAGRLGCARLG